MGDRFALRIFVIVAVFGLLWSVARAEEIFMACAASHAQACSPAGCIQQRSAKTTKVSSEGYFRCDSADWTKCDRVEYAYDESGQFMQFSFYKGGGGFAKISLNGAIFLEIVTIMNHTLIYYGECVFPETGASK